MICVFFVLNQKHACFGTLFAMNPVKAVQRRAGFDQAISLGQGRPSLAVFLCGDAAPSFFSDFLGWGER
jgi:hypothetical protein